MFKYTLVGTLLITASLSYAEEKFITKLAKSGEDILHFSDDGRSAYIRVLARNEDTGGRFSAAEHYFPEGYSGPGSHVHHGIVQAIYVVSGSVQVNLIENCQYREVFLEEGSFLSIAPEAYHTFYSQKGAKVLAIDAPGDLIPMFEAMSAIDRSLPKEEQDNAMKSIRKKKFDNDFSAPHCDL